MGKDKRATKRDLKKWIEENISESHGLRGNYGAYEYWDSSWKLTRHPYAKKKHSSGKPFRHRFGSPKHMNRLVTKKYKQMNRQIDRNKRRNETKTLISEQLNDNICS